MMQQWERDLRDNLANEVLDGIQVKRENTKLRRVVGRLLRLCDDNGLGDAARKAIEGIGDEA